jgi:hypothetical protein
MAQPVHAAPVFEEEAPIVASVVRGSVPPASVARSSVIRPSVEHPPASVIVSVARPASLLMGPTITGLPFSTAPWSMAGAFPAELPVNLQVPENLRPMLRQMLSRSVMFREQINALARKPHVRMVVSYGGARNERPYYALSTVRKHQWGAMFIDTTIFLPGDVVELLAHELEHVREQMEGVDLRSLAGRRHAGVFDLNGHFETERAIEAGQRVSREYQNHTEALSGALVY